MTSTSTSLRIALLLTLSNGFLDPYTYICRGGAFSTTQTANVVFFAAGLAAGHWPAAIAKLWPILAFMVGVALATHIRSGRLYLMKKHPLRWVMAVQALVLTVVGFVPASVSPTAVAVAVSFVAAMQMALFRSIGDLTFVAIATTGNLMRFVEQGYAGIVKRDAEGRRGFRVYALMILAFAAGAVLGATTTQVIGTRAAWLPAVFVGATLLLLLFEAPQSLPDESA
ncbi:uncharacterized membrane protein YoaK (UPF0700 family) [Mycobacterium sp. MAA66]|jgi:uncharacterized membrane protein YoaK (UPF0700 family)|uniref:YoaK family protein n=1 Tax=Mycobacterium sp. MAA66 TaxID=3156297 RepID=UPI003515A469